MYIHREAHDQEITPRPGSRYLLFPWIVHSYICGLKNRMLADRWRPRKFPLANAFRSVVKSVPTFIMAMRAAGI